MSGVLITGGTGFLGHGLVKRLLAEGHQRVRVYSRNEHAQANMAEHFGTDERLAFFVGDVRDVERLERAMHHCESVIHAAALKRIEVGHYNPDEMTKTNVQGTMNVLEAARRAKVRRVVLVSSDKAFEPVSPYGLSKALAEQLFFAANRQNLGPRHVVCRYGNVAGSTGSVIPTWRARIARGDGVMVTDPACTRFWMRLDEAVALVLRALVDVERELLIPQLPAYQLGDLAAAMDVEPKVVGLNGWEKKHEAMGPGNSSDRARRLTLPELRTELAEVP